MAKRAKHANHNVKGHTELRKKSHFCLCIQKTASSTFKRHQNPKTSNENPNQEKNQQAQEPNLEEEEEDRAEAGGL